MKTLLLMRHAKSSWADGDLADYDRPLNARGQRDAPRMAAFLEQSNLLPDIICSSTAVRARTTVELLVEEVQYERTVHWLDELYLAPPSVYAEIARQLDDSAQSAMMVAHNPGIEAAIEMLTGEWERMPTAAIAVIELPIDTWREFPAEQNGKLLDIYRPKELD